MASLAILEKIGAKVSSQEILKLLAQMGAEVDFGGQVVKFPSYLTEEMVRKIPKRYVIYARNPDHDMRVGYGEMRFISSGGQVNIVDPIAKTRRPGTTKDMINAIILGDGLENIDVVGPMVTPQDVPIGVADVHAYAALVKNSSKVVFGWINSRKTARYILKMFETLAGGRDELQKKPMIWYFCEPTSPLQFEARSLGILREFAERGLPVCFGPMVMAGATGPATLAGTLAMENAEILAGTLIAETLCPGIPVEYGGIPHIFDQRMGAISFGSPEQGIMAAAIAQLGRYYGFPVHVNAGLTDSKLPDAQAGFEKGMTILMGALAGAELFSHLGIAGADMGACPEQLVIDNELVCYLTRLIKGFEVSNETLAVDISKKVGIGGNFLMQKHTLKHIRSEFWYPELCDRRVWDKWYENGARDMLTRAKERVKEIVQTHRAEPLDKDVEEDINSIVKEAEKDTFS